MGGKISKLLDCEEKEPDFDESDEENEKESPINSNKLVDHQVMQVKLDGN